MGEYEVEVEILQSKAFQMEIKQLFCAKYFGRNFYFFEQTGFETGCTIIGRRQSSFFSETSQTAPIDEKATHKKSFFETNQFAFFSVVQVLIDMDNQADLKKILLFLLRILKLKAKIIEKFAPSVFFPPIDIIFRVACY